MDANGAAARDGVSELCWYVTAALPEEMHNQKMDLNSTAKCNNTGEPGFGAWIAGMARSYMDFVARQACRSGPWPRLESGNGLQAFQFLPELAYTNCCTSQLNPED